MSATITVLTTGYAAERVASTVTLIRSEKQVIVVDPGMVAARELILGPLREAGLDAAQVTDVVLSHHHPDHTMNVALFPRARVHDFMATYFDDEWIDHDDGDFAVTDEVRLTRTPGHSDEDVSTLVDTDAGLVVLTHLWWSAQGPADDPFSRDPAVLAESRRRILDLEPVLIVPGHGAPFTRPEV